jgi:hypothetical protein
VSAENETAVEAERDEGDKWTDEAVDPILANLVHLMNEISRTTGITAAASVTLIVGGSVVTGNLTGARGWWEEQAKRAGTFTSGGEAEGSAEAAQMIGDTLRAEYETIAKNYEEVEGRPVGYLHLRDAQVGVGPAVRAKGLDIRLRLTEVQGWSLGIRTES